MPHFKVIQAQSVLSNKSAYPECICSDAQRIVDWSEAKRATIRAMWRDHSVFQRWNAAYRQSVSKTSMLKSRDATAVLRKGASEAQLRTLHQTRQCLRNTQVPNALLFNRFEAMLQLLASNDLVRIHRYMACVNAQRLDGTLESVGFLRWCGGAVASEILAWRLLRVGEVVHA